MKLIIMRHGKCVGLKEKVINGWLDFPLTEEGIKEATKKARYIKDYNIDMAFSSYLSRSFDTARLMLKALKSNCKVVQDIRLNERHYGFFQGMDRSKAYEYPEYNTLSVSAKRLDNRLIPLSEEKYRLQCAEYSEKLGVPESKLVLPRAESILDVENRIIDFFQEMVFIPDNKDKTILIVGHANTVKLMVKYIENLSFEDTTKLRFATCGMKIYDIVLDKSKITILGSQNINEEWSC